MAENEKGYANTTSSVRRVKNEKTWELRWPQNQVTFEEMLRTSAKISQVEMAWTQPIERATWRVSPNGAPDHIVQHVADDLRLPVHGAEDGMTKRRSAGRVSWAEHLQKVVRTPFYGVSFFEQVYEVGEDGREHLVKLAERHNTTIQKIVVAEDGGLEGIVQRPRGGHDSVWLSVDRLVAYPYRPSDATWTGESLLRPMYKHWRAIADLEALEFQIIHRNGMGVPVHKQSLNTAPEDRESEKDEGLLLAKGVQAGDTAGMTLNPGADFELVGVKGQLISPREAIKYHNDKIAESVGANFLNLEGGGSYAMIGTQADFYFQELQTTADWITSVANQHIVEDLVRVAYPDYDGPCPLITSTPIAAKKDIAPGDVAQLVNAGALLKEPNLEGWLRQNYDIPEARSLYEALQAQKSKQEAEAEVGVTLGTESDSTKDNASDTSGQIATLNMIRATNPEALRGVLTRALNMVDQSRMGGVR